MHDITRDLFVSLAAFAALFGVIYIYLTTRHRERMSMLERGMDPTLTAARDRTKSNTLKLGMLCVGIGTGTLLGNVLYTNFDMTRTVAFFSMIFLTGGVSLIAYFLVERNLKP